MPKSLALPFSERYLCINGAGQSSPREGVRIIIKLKTQSSKLKWIGLGVTGMVVAGFFVYSQAGAQVVRPPQVTRFSYAAKFICGVQSVANIDRQEPPVKKGNYATAINIHNPQANRTKIFKKVVIARPEPDQGKPTQKFEHVLESDGAMEIDCREINLLLARDGQIQPSDNAFRKGFLVVESPVELDVVGVYTANTDAKSLTDPVSQPNGMAMDVEYIPGRRLVGLQSPTASDETSQ